MLYSAIIDYKESPLSDAPQNNQTVVLTKGWLIENDEYCYILPSGAWISDKHLKDIKPISLDEYKKCSNKQPKP